MWSYARFVVALCLASAVLSLAACGGATSVPAEPLPTGTAAPAEVIATPLPRETRGFELVAQREVPGPGPQQPAVWLVTQPGEVESLPLDRGTLRTLASRTDWQKDVLVVLAAAQKMSSGYTVNLQRLTVKDNELVFTVELVGPSPEQDVAPAEHVPYAVVKVLRATLPAAPDELTIVMEDPDGKRLAASSPPVSVPAKPQPFTTLVQEEVTGSGPEKPAIGVLAHPSDIEKQAWTPRGLAAIADQFNFDDEILVVLVWGQRSTSGYSIELQRVEVKEDRLVFIANLLEPASDRDVAPAFHAAYLIASIPRASLPVELQQLTFILADPTGAPLATTSYP